MGIYSVLEAKKIEQYLIDAVGVGIKNKSYNVAARVDQAFLSEYVKDKIRKKLRDPNTMFSGNKSGYKGVCFYKRNEKWKASIGRNGRSYHIGYYEDIQKARMAYLKINALTDKKFEKWWKNVKPGRDRHEYQWGENGPGSRLTDDQVRSIILLCEKGHTQKEVAKKFKIDQASVSNIVTGKRRHATKR